MIWRRIGGLDSSAVAKMRSPWLTSVAVDLTALGSITLVVLISVVALCILLSLGDRLAAWQPLLNSLGAGIWTVITIERHRTSSPRMHHSVGAGFRLFISQWTVTRFRLAIPDDCNPCSALFPNKEGSRSTVEPCRYCHFAGLCVAGVLGCGTTQVTSPAALR